MTQAQSTDIRPMYRVLYDTIVSRSPTKGQLVVMTKDYIPAGTVHVYVGLMIRSGFIYVSPTTGQLFRTIRPSTELNSTTMQELKVTHASGDFMMTQVNQNKPADTSKTTETSKATGAVVQASAQSTSVSVPPRTISQKMVVDGVRPVLLDAVYTLNVGGISIEMSLSELRLLKQQIDNVVNI